MFVRFTRLSLISLAALSCPCVIAQMPSHLHGTVKDPVGSVIANAKVELISGDHVVGVATTSADGRYQLDVPVSGLYTLRLSAASFDTTVTPARFLSSTANVSLDLALATPTLTQEVTVTANGTPTPVAQVAASVTVLNKQDFALMPEIQEPLRLVPGVQITQTGEMGGTSGLNIRGSKTDATKVLIDGVPTNQIGGGVEFANLATTGIESIEVLREPNSAIYGSDALAGVVSMSTTRATTRLPLITYSGDAGNFGTYRNEVTAGTVYRQFDLYSTFARIDTRNNEPNSEFHNATYAGNFGWAPDAANDVRFTVRHAVVNGGQPNAIALYGIADAAQQKEQDDYYNVAWNNQTTTRWHNQIRYGGVRQNGLYTEFGTAGTFDANDLAFDGAVVNITGANGYRVSGQAILQYGPSQYVSTTKRDFAYAQTDYQVTPHLLALGAFKYENESGSSISLPGTASASDFIERGNYSYTMQLSGNAGKRLFYMIGTGLEDNGLFGFAATPRASVAYYLFRPSSSFFSGTKLHGTFSKGIKEPSLYDQNASLYAALALNNLLGQYPSVKPLGAEESRSFDGGVDQEMLNGRARLGVTYFHNEFTNGVEYVPYNGLEQLGVPGNQFLGANYIGAYLNSLAYRAQGIEFEFEYKLSNHLVVRGGYTYTDAVVQRSFSSDSLSPSYNTSFNFSNIAIGAYSPLVGARPFRIAPHTGYFALSYTHSKFHASMTGTLVGRRDDSDFLSDTTYGTSLLLPNRNLLGAYQRLELGGGYQMTRRVSVYANIQNLLSEHYFEAFGYPALPLTFRTGVKLNFGGESWNWR